MRCVLVLLVFAAARAFASDPVPAVDLPSQGNFTGIIGVTGGIPTGQTIFTNFTSANSVGQINTGISLCPSNQVVHLAAGTYSIGSQIVLQKDGVIVRGDVDANGVPSTFLNCSVFIPISMGDPGFDTSNVNNWNTVTVNSGFTRGSTTLTLASIPSGCVTNALLWLSATTNSVINGDNFALFLGTDPYLQIVKVTGISGNNVTIFPAINADFLSALRASTSKKTVYHRMGIENLSMYGSQLTYVESYGTDENWMRNCIVSNSPNGAVRQVYLYTVNRFELRHSDLGTISAAGSDAYSVFGQDCTGVWVEDNYFHNAPNFYPQFAAQDCAFSYNFVTNCPYGQQPGWLSQIVFNHGLFNCYNDYEGNYNPTYYDDGFRDNVNDVTITRSNVRLRDRLVGWDGSDGGKTMDCHAITILGPSTNCALAGCLLGKVGFTANYLVNSGTSSTTTCYWFDTDSAVGLYGNWNAVDQGVHSTEVLSGGQVIANSYIYGSKPAFFGFLNWPPYDPGNSTAAGISWTNIPAGYRVTFGTDPPASTIAGSATLNDGRLTVKDGTLTFGQ